VIEQYALPITVAVVLLLSLSWHEAAHAWVADKLGDPTARSLGRVSMNPIRHLDPFLSFILPGILLWLGGPVIGGGKPVPINPTYFKNRARDFMLVALAGPGSNLLIALVCGLVFALSVSAGWIGPDTPEVIPQAARMGMTHVVAGPPSLLDITDDLVFRGERPESGLALFLVLAVALNIGLAVFNMLPLPPLDGSRVIGWLLPRPLQAAWYRLDRIGIFLVFVVILYLGGLELVLGVALSVLRYFTYGTDQLVALLT